MIWIVKWALIATALAVELPHPKLSHLTSGGMEFSIDDIPNLETLEVKYSIAGNHFQGHFNQAADSRWYHQTAGVEGFKGIKNIPYTMIGLVDGDLIVYKGKITPDTGLELLPPKRVNREATVVFRDDFNDGCSIAAGWDYEVSMYGGYNGEVQVYVPDAKNVFCRYGYLYIKPTLTMDDSRYGSESALHTGTMDLKAMYGYCTNADRNGCYRAGQNGLLPPVMSGKIKSKKTIRFGSVEIRAKIPSGDWLWPAIWMLPRNSEYGEWPRSGEIDIMESRGNDRASDASTWKPFGRATVGASLRYAPNAHGISSLMEYGDMQANFWEAFYTYRLDWTADHIQVFVDGRNLMNIPITERFRYEGGDYYDKVWASGTKAAPFDKDFYLILNVAVGGTNGYFPDAWNYNTRKPWNNSSPTVPQDFWNARNDWLPTWQGDASAMVIDYVQMTQY